VGIVTRKERKTNTEIQEDILDFFLGRRKISELIDEPKERDSKNKPQ